MDSDGDVPALPCLASPVGLGPVPPGVQLQAAPAHGCVVPRGVGALWSATRGCSRCLQFGALMNEVGMTFWCAWRRGPSGPRVSVPATVDVAQLFPERLCRFARPRVLVALHPH